MDIDIEKKRIRKNFLEERKQLSETEVAEKSNLIFNNFKTAFSGYLPGIVHIFQSISSNREPQTDSFFQHFDSAGWQIAVPVIVDSDLRLKHLLWNADIEMKANRWGIPEPVFEHKIFRAEQFDLIVVPLLGFDQSGNRLGYGKGYYDRFLSQTRKDCLKIGIAFELSKCIQTLPHDEFDVPLNSIVTEKTIYRF